MNVGARSPERTASTDTEQEDAAYVRQSKCAIFLGVPWWPYLYQVDEPQ